MPTTDRGVIHTVFGIDFPLYRDIDEDGVMLNSREVSPYRIVYVRLYRDRLINQQGVNLRDSVRNSYDLRLCRLSADESREPEAESEADCKDENFFDSIFHD